MANGANQYLLSFLATLQGDKAVVRGLTQMERAVNKQSKTMGVAGKSTKNFMQVINGLASRALLTIPVWLALRGAIMGLISTIGGMVRAGLDLEDGMARIRTVLQGTAEQIDRDMINIQRQILTTALNTSVSIKELAEAFYFLRTAGISTEEAMALFNNAVHLMVGTGNSAKDTVRGLVGAWNTMNKSLEENLTLTERAQKVTDILAFTYATQDVQLDELIQSYTKLAPYLSGLDDSFSDIVTTLGFLNTRLLRSGRTGRLTGRAILQLTKNSKKLASIFGITFDPDKPISFLKTIEQVYNRMSDTTKITAKQGQAIQEVFATRAGVPIRLLLTHFEDLQLAMQNATDNAEGFAKTMHDIRMNTIRAQTKELTNTLQVLGIEFVSGVFGTGDFVEALKELNAGMEFLIPGVRFLGDLIGYLSTQLSNSVLVIGQVSKAFEEASIWEKLLPGGAISTLIRANKELEKMGITVDDTAINIPSFKKFREERRKLAEETKTQRDKELKIRENLEDAEKGKLTNEKLAKEEIRHQSSLLKAIGVHALDIAKSELERLEILREEGRITEDSVELEKAKNKVIEEQAKFRQRIQDQLRNVNITILKLTGATELEILNIKRAQLIVDRQQIGEVEYLNRLAKLRGQEAVAINKLKKDELTTATNLYLQYAKADAVGKKQIERLFELVKLAPGQLARLTDIPFDFAVITKYWQHFTDEQQRAIGEAVRREQDLDKFVGAEAWDERERAIERAREARRKWLNEGAKPEERPDFSEILDPSTAPIPTDFMDFFKVDVPKEFWQNWTEQGRLAQQVLADEAFVKQQVETPPQGISDRLNQNVSDILQKLALQQKLAEQGINISIENITVERDWQKASEQIVEKLKEAEQEIKTNRKDIGIR